jgi:hypothetical protein
MDVFVIEYTDADGASSAEGVYATAEIAKAWAHSLANERLETDYDKKTHKVIEDETVGGALTICIELLTTATWESWTIHKTPLITELPSENT